MRVLNKWIEIILLLLMYFAISAFLFMLPLNATKKRNYAIQTTSLFARYILSVLGVRVHLKNRERLHTKNGCLIISNHVSYVDVLVLSSLIPSVFITSVELKNTALLGTIAKCSGSIFIERRKATGLKKEIEWITTVLKDGFPVVLFPEGTTSNGDRVMHFKNSLFDAAVITQVDVLPICIRYTKIDNKRLTPQTRDAVFYYGGITFSEHVPRLLLTKSIDADVIPLRTINVHTHLSRKDLATMTHKAISTAFNE